MTTGMPGPASGQEPGTTRTLLTQHDDSGALVGRVRRTVLNGGLRVITEIIPGVRSAAVGVYVGVGSRHEQATLSGGSHFLEHLLFKGTRERSAMEISAAFDGVGGEFNAYTAKEYTCYHARVIDQDLPLAIDVLGDMLTSSVITPFDVEAEREVILDEIAMHDDDPDDAVHNLFAEHGWRGTTLAKPIAGRPDSITALTRSQIWRYYRKHYVAPAMTVAAAGNLDHADVVDLVQRAFGRRGFLEADAAPQSPRLVATSRPLRAGRVAAHRQIEQVNLLLGMRGITRTDSRRHALAVLNSAVGGGTSSRLFQEVREKRGLAYSVFSFASSYSDAGTVGISAGCLPAKADLVLDTAREVLRDVATHGLTDEELARAKGQLRGGLVLGLEDPASRMHRLGEAELFQPALRSVEEILASIDAVTLEGCRELARDLYSRRETLAIVGP